MIYKRVILLIAVKIVCCVSWLFAVQAWSEEPIIRTNRQFITYVEDGKNLVVYDLQKKQSFKRAVGCALRDIEINPSYPFLSFTCTKENHKAYFLYDLEKRKVYESNFYLDIFEHRWSPLGAYTYFNKETSFLVVSTENLRDHLQEPKNEQIYIEIMGHPLGSISQIAWIGENLLYRTGVGEMECWGSLDLPKRENSLVSCCGMAKFSPCSKQNRQDDSVIKLFIEKSEKGNMRPTSTDFYNDVLRMEQSKKIDIGPNL